MRKTKSSIAALTVLVASILLAFPQAKQIIAPPGSGVSGLPFSPGVRSGDLLYLAGAMATDSAGKIVPGDIEAQTRKTLENLGVVLKAAGMGFEDVVAATVYLTDSRLFEGMNRAYREIFKMNPPVRATVEADLVLPGGLVEISLTAARPGLKKDVINPQGWSSNPLPYSRAIRVGDYLFVAGLVSQDPRTGTPFPGDVKVQTKQTLDNIKTLVEAAGFRMSDMTVSRVWLSDPRDFQAMNEVYRGYFTDVPPTRATVRGRLMNPQYNVEIMLSGIKGERQRVGTPGASPLSPAIKVGNRLFVSGIVRATPQTRGDLKGQTRAALEEIRTLLQQAGMDFSDAVDATVWITDVRNFAAMNEVYREFIPQNPPARATVGMSLMGADGLVEIAMIAAK